MPPDPREHPAVEPRRWIAEEALKLKAQMSEERWTIRVCYETGSRVAYHEGAQKYRHMDGTRCDHRFDPVEVVPRSQLEKAEEALRGKTQMSEGGITLLRHIREDGSKARWHIPGRESAAALDSLDLPYEIEEFVPRSRLEKAEEERDEWRQECIEGLEALKRANERLVSLFPSHPEEPK